MPRKPRPAAATSDIAAEFGKNRELSAMTQQVLADAVAAGQAPDVIETPDDHAILEWLAAERLHTQAQP